MKQPLASCAAALAAVMARAVLPEPVGARKNPNLEESSFTKKSFKACRIGF
jgi:hypothetical protein